MIHGPDIEVTREAAKRQVMWHLVNQSEIADGTPPTLRAAYVAKAQEATRVLAGEASAGGIIEREAALRGYTPFEMATIIDQMAGVMLETEMLRMQINVGIEKAVDESEIADLLQKQLGIVLQINS